MPDMPMPPMPTKWIVPMSVPIAFIMPAWLRRERRAVTRGAERRADRDRRNAVADPLDQVGEIARRMRTADRQSARRGIVERDRVHRQRLDLPREHVGREVALRDRARAAGLDHLARVGGLVIVGRRGERDEDRGPPGRAQLGDGRRARPADHQMRVGELLGHVLDIGRELGGNAELGILRANALDVVGAALLDDLQAAAKRRLEHAEAFRHDRAEDARALAAAGDEDLERRIFVERRERHLAEPRDLLAHRIADQDRPCPRYLGFSRSTSS